MLSTTTLQLFYSLQSRLASHRIQSSEFNIPSELCRIIWWLVEIVYEGMAGSSKVRPLRGACGLAVGKSEYIIGSSMFHSELGAICRFCMTAAQRNLVSNFDEAEKLSFCTVRNKFLGGQARQFNKTCLTLIRVQELVKQSPYPTFCHLNNTSSSLT